MAQTGKKPCSRGMALAKFLIFSGLGIFMFFVNVEIGGKNVIIIQHMINFVKATCAPVIPYYALAMVAFGAIYPLITKAYKRSTFDLAFTIAKAFGLIIGVMGVFNVGPAPLMTDDMIPFLWNSLVVPITLSIPLTGLAYVMMLNFGLVEFIGAFMRPVMQKIWKTPGESAVDAIVSYAGGYSLAVILTSDFYKKGIYTHKQAFIISTGFSTVATSFLMVIANTLDLTAHWSLYFFTCAFVTFAVTAITCRIYPTSKIPDTYYDKPAPKSPERTGSLFSQALEDALEVSQNTDPLLTHLKRYYVGDAMKMTASVTASILTIGLIGLVVAEYTPVFDLLGYIFYPFTLLMQLPEPMIAAKAAAIEIAEMFLPAMLVTSVPMVTKFTIAVTSVSAVLFFSASIPSLLSTDIPVKMKDIILIWIERTILSLILAGAIAHLLF